MSTWPVPVNMMYIEAGVKYAIEYIEGRTKNKAKVDADLMAKIMSGIAGGKVELANYKDYPNFFMYLSDFYLF